MTATLQETVRSLAYRTPAGFADVPYCYLYDASALADGSNNKNLSLIVDQDTDFVLRRIVGANLCVNSNATGSFQVFDKSRLQFFQSAIRPGSMPASLGGGVSGSWPVMPERLYPASSQIGFDLNGVLRNFTADNPNIFNSQLGFWGVRRFNKQALYVHNTDYAYHELPHTYQSGLFINWGHWTDASGAGIANNPRKFFIQVLETDFELCSIGVTYANGQPVTANDFQITLYMPDGFTRLSSAPMNLPFWNYNAPIAYGNPVYPVPSIVYPTKGLIQFEITSMLPVGTAESYMLHFTGIWRARN